MKVSSSNTGYMCVNETETDVTMKMQGVKIVKADEFKYLV